LYVPSNAPHNVESLVSWEDLRMHRRVDDDAGVATQKGLF